MLKLLRRHPRLLFFGVLTAMFSGPGQTFLVSLFIPHMREAFGMNQAQIAGYYSAATLLSAGILPWTGRILDRSSLMVFTLAAGALLATGLLVLNLSTGVISLFIGFLLIRNLGQGTLTMISSTTMARVFGRARGKALGISNLGYPLGEALFPSLVVFWLAHYGWREGWFFLGALTALFFIPAAFFLIRGAPHKNSKILHEFQEDTAYLAGKVPEKEEFKDHGHWTVAQMFKDWRFYVLIVPLLIPPTFFTGLFFHQASLMEWKGWSLARIASVGFIFFGVCRAIVSFVIGPMIDRYSAKKLFPINLIPFIAGVFLLTTQQGEIWGLVYLGLSGMTMGLGMTMSGALYAEFYGTKSLGSIKGIISSLVVLSTAVSPVLMGIYLDRGMDPATLLWGMMITLIVGTIMSWIACSR